MAKAENKSESQKTAEFLREVFKGKTIKTARRHKNDKYVTLVFTDGAKLTFDNDIYWDVNGDVVEPGEEPGTVKVR
jgi:predicted ribosome quality control (RQC) complex YloA/Tae2 family protein